ncbi:DEAD/DEAH box helicase [Clostridium sp. DJ247]|uniref:DEAD/DEAH box helicase n=1 Tax=Clostridium sp. DJ247 TaxID=2726188 RepID=UPI001624D0E6|nr:DEAD/DEAH box helicase [Clostridium sp. DJ247]MBC2579402.1 DEAD/DEAH box helicase [Clostridium sp. DJ247]
MKWIDSLSRRALEDPYFQELLEKLETKYAYKFFKSDRNIKLSEKEYNDILRFADILCRSESADGRNKAYKVISLLYEFYNTDIQYKIYANTVLTKLGNFPSLELAIGEENNFGTPEIVMEKFVKKTFQESPYEGFVFTDPQYKLYEALKRNNHYSFSGPTSFGKSFIMEAFINYIITERHGVDNVVVLVPTRALINQVSNKLKAQINNEKYKVLSHPVVPMIFKRKEYKYIFVFTPERLISYLADKDNPIINYMFIDEAQKIIAKKDSRSPLYYHAVLLAERKSIKLYFASPNIPNAEVFLQLFEKSSDEKMVIEESPVAQNRFFIDLINNKALFFSEYGKEIELPSLSVSRTNKLNIMINYLGKGCKNIVYCNTVEDTINFALEFANTLPEISDYRIDAVIELIKTYVHKEYYLIDCLKKGVAFHFGRLPQRIREKVENLFKEKAIDYMFCTSTLLEGVNLPAKNIFILSNAIGMTKFTDIDFWNLAGRAGRLSKELCGNIICVRAVQKKNRWDDIQKDLEVVRNKKIKKVVPYVISGEKNFYKNIGFSLQDTEFTRKDASQTEKEIWNHYANIVFIHQVTNNDSILISNFLKKNANAKQILVKVEKQNLVSEYILEQCSAIKPMYQNKVWNLEINDPAFPDSITTETCKAMLNRLYDLYNWGQEESGGRNPLVKDRSRLNYFAVLMYTWMKGIPLNLIIVNLIKYYSERGVIWDQTEYINFNRNNRRHINIVINNLISDIDNALRYKLKNYFLNYYLIISEKYGKQNVGANWAEYLEYGTIDSLTIELQNIGLPRHLSLFILENYSECLEFEDGKLVDLKEDILKNAIRKENKEEYKELKEFLNWDN